MKIQAYLPCFNEADVLPHTLRHLHEQGCSVHVIDGIDAENCIRGTITEIIEGQVLLDIDTGERRPAMRFVIRDRTGVHHITQAMSAGALPPVADKQEAGTVSRELPDSKSSVEEQN